jgi:TolB protein
MARRLLRVSALTMLTFALLLGGGSAGADFVHADPNASIAALLPCSDSQASEQFELRSTIAFSSTRDYSSTRDAEIYLGVPMKKDDGSWVLTQQQRLTNTPANAYVALSPDGKRMVFDSNRDVPGRPVNISDLFVMNADGTDQTRLTQGSSATWSPDCKYIAFHASASGHGTPINSTTGAATSDSDIFVMNVDDCLKVKQAHQVDDCREIPGEHLKNITKSENGTKELIYDDADWSPDGTMIAFTGKNVSDNGGGGPVVFNYTTGELYVMRVDSTGKPVQSSPQQLTVNNEEERSPNWSPDGKRILIMCRRGTVPGGPVPEFRHCILNKMQDGMWLEQPSQLSATGVYSTSAWSPDGTQIVFHRPITGQGQQLFLLKITTNPDGTVRCVGPAPLTCDETQLTFRPGINVFPDWGVLRVHSGGPTVTQPARAPAATPLPQRRGR